MATAATAYAGLFVTTRALRARVDAQVLNAAALVRRSDFALNTAILGSAKAIAGADVVQRQTLGTHGVRRQQVFDATISRTTTERFSMTVGVRFVSASWSIPSPTRPVPGARAHATFPRVMALATYGFRFGSAKAPHRANTAICDETNDR